MIKLAVPLLSLLVGLAFVSAPMPMDAKAVMEVPEPPAPPFVAPVPAEPEPVAPEEVPAPE